MSKRAARNRRATNYLRGTSTPRRLLMAVLDLAMRDGEPDWACNSRITPVAISPEKPLLSGGMPMLLELARLVTQARGPRGDRSGRGRVVLWVTER